ELVAIGTEVLAQQDAEGLLGRPVGRAVVVGEVEVGDPEVERAADDLAARLQRAVAAEVLPEAERDRWQEEPAAAAAAEGHLVVTARGGDVDHRLRPARRRRR